MTGRQRRKRRKTRNVTVLCAGLMVLAGALATVWAGTGQAAVLPVIPAETAAEAAAVQWVPVEPPAAADVPEAAEPAPEPMADTYFSDAVFLGDSRTEGFSLYSGLQEGTCLFAVGATVESVFTKAVPLTDGGEAPLLDTLATTDCGKIYVMLGINELGWVHAETYKTQYGKVIDRLRADHPDAAVVVQSLPPVSAAQDAKHSYVNNRRIRTYNTLLAELATEKDCSFVDVAAAVTGADGCLPAEMTFDGVHLNSAGCKAWLEVLRGAAV